MLGQTIGPAVMVPDDKTGEQISWLEREKRREKERKYQAMLQATPVTDYTPGYVSSPKIEPPAPAPQMTKEPPRVVVDTTPTPPRPRQSTLPTQMVHTPQIMPGREMVGFTEPVPLTVGDEASSPLPFTMPSTATILGVTAAGIAAYFLLR